MDHFEKDWLYFKAAATDLPDYLLSNELYLPLVVKGASRWRSALEPLTLGNLLLAQFRLGACKLPADLQLEVDHLSIEVSRLRNQWRTAWGKKVAQEVLARTKSWGQFLGEWFEDRGKNLTGYTYQVRQRVILDILLPDIQNPNLLMQEQIKAYDRNLRELTRPGTFIWETELADGFPQERFWYLYVAS